MIMKLKREGAITQHSLSTTPLRFRYMQIKKGKSNKVLPLMFIQRGLFPTGTT